MNNNKKTVLIIGASKGVGAACARYYAQLGANLALVARNQNGLDNIANELSAHTQVATFTCDVSQIESLEPLITQVVEHFHGIDILINNAGLHHRGNFETLTPIQVTQMAQLNFTAPLLLTSLCLPYLKHSSTASIVNVGSLAGRAPLQGAATYSATKAGLRAFSYALFDELIEHDIKVAVVSPGPIDTGFIMDEIDNVEDIVYSQPMSSAEQVAQAIAELTQPTEKVEIAMPWFSGKLTTIGYLFPRFRRLTRPLLYKIGKKNKQKYRKLG